MAITSRNPIAFVESVSNQIDLVKTNAYVCGSGTELLLLFAGAMESSSLLTGGKAGQLASATYAGAALTLAGRYGGAGAGANDVCAEIWQKVSPAFGSNNLVSTWAAQTDATSYIAVELIGGVNLASPVGSTIGVNEGATGPVTCDIVTESDNSLIVGLAVTRRGATAKSDPFNPTSGSEVADGNSGSDTANSDLSYWVATLQTTTAGTYTVSANVTANNNWKMVLVEVKVASSAAGDAAGTGDAPGIGESTAESVAAAAGAATVVAVGNALKPAVGAASGAATVNGVAEGLAPAVGSMPAGAATWEPSISDTAVTFSNGDLTAEVTAPPASGQAWYYVRTATSRSSGQYYFEVEIDAASDGVPISLGAQYALAAGIIKDSKNISTISDDDYPGQNDYSAIADSSNSARWNNGSSVLAGIDWTDPTERIGIAIDLDTGEMWFRDASGYNTGDPETGDTPSISGITTGIEWALVAMVGSDAADTVMSKLTVIFAEGDWDYAAPAGFATWEGVTPTGIATVAGAGTAITSGSGGVQVGAGVAAGVGASIRAAVGGAFGEGHADGVGEDVATPGGSGDGGSELFLRRRRR